MPSFLQTHLRIFFVGPLGLRVHSNACDSEDYFSMKFNLHLNLYATEKEMQLKAESWRNQNTNPRITGLDSELLGSPGQSRYLRG